MSAFKEEKGRKPKLRLRAGTRNISLADQRAEMQ